MINSGDVTDAGQTDNDDEQGEIGKGCSVNGCWVAELGAKTTFLKKWSQEDH